MREAASTPATAFRPNGQQRAELAEIAAPKKEAAKLKTECDIPKRAETVFRQWYGTLVERLPRAGGDTTLVFVAKHRHIWPPSRRIWRRQIACPVMVSRMCDVLGISGRAFTPGSGARSAPGRATMRSSSWRSTGDVAGLSVGDRVAVDPMGSARPEAPAAGAISAHLQKPEASPRTEESAKLAVIRTDDVVSVGDMPCNLAALSEPTGCPSTASLPWIRCPLDKILIFAARPVGLLIGQALRGGDVFQAAFVGVDTGRPGPAMRFGRSAVASGSSASRTCARGTSCR